MQKESKIFKMHVIRKSTLCTNILFSISISIFYFCCATVKTERNKETYRTIAKEEKGRSNKTLNVIACTQ